MLKHIYEGKISEAAKEFIKLNIHKGIFSDLRYKYDETGKEFYYSIPKSYILIAEDLTQKVAEIQKARNEISYSPINGDVIYFGEKKTKLCEVRKDNSIQLSDGDYYMNLNGTSSMGNGGFDYPKETKGKKEYSFFWNFLRGAGANKGYYFYIEVNAWTLK